MKHYLWSVVITVTSQSSIACRFILNADKIELTIEVKVIQDVSPKFSFSNPGEVIFQTLPDDNPLSLAPIICTNTTSGSVNIHPVILHPWNITWSSVEATNTESPANPSYVTIGERFNMTTMACMPETHTGVELRVSVPQRDGMPAVRVMDAYVTFIGSNILNTTLQEGDGEGR